MDVTMNDRDPRRRLIAGAAAGAVGATLLNVVTYLDMLVRGRPPSSVPQEDVERIEDVASIPVPDSVPQKRKRAHRESAAGALMGYVVGVGVGALTGAFWPILRGLPLPVAGGLVGGSAMASSDVPSFALGTSDPRTWQATSWAADILPHIAYGIASVAVTAALLTDERAAA
jgi:hypothetical protein